MKMKTKMTITLTKSDIDSIVKDFLTKKGIDSRRIKVVGYGTSKPLASNDDENDGRELNRRVEFKIIK